MAMEKMERIPTIVEQMRKNGATPLPPESDHTEYAPPLLKPPLRRLYEELASEAQTIRDGQDDLLAVAVRIFYMRHGLFIKMCEAMEADSGKVYSWAESQLTQSTEALASKLMSNIDSDSIA